MLLVLVLLVVDLCGSAAAAVHGDDQAALACGCVTIARVPEGHHMSAVREHALFHLRSALGADALYMSSPELDLRLFGLLLRQSLFEGEIDELLAFGDGEWGAR